MMDIVQTRKHARDAIWYLNLLQFDSSFNSDDSNLIAEDCRLVLKFVGAWKSDMEKFRSRISAASANPVRNEFFKIGARTLINRAARLYAMLERMEPGTREYRSTTDAIIDILVSIEKKISSFANNVKTFQIEEK